MTAVRSVLVVGASAAGLTTAEALRRKGFTGTLTLLGAERELPYDRPPLSKQVLSGAWEPERAQLRSTQALAALDAEFVLGDPAVGFDADSREVTTASGRTLTADAVVIATGVTARTLPDQRGVRGTHVVRNLEDAAALRADLLSARRVVVIGDGVLGAETAATARQMGLDVTLVGPQAAPMTEQLGPLVAGHLADLHLRNGVELRGGVLLDALHTQGGAVTGLRLSDGTELEADVVVTAVGCVPATDWLGNSGLNLDNGVVCDAHCRAAPGVWAVGDVARWHHQGLGRPVRLENRTNASEQGLVVAADILGNGKPYLPVPYFWTDQFDVKLQVHGIASPVAQAEVVEGDPVDGRFVVRLEGPLGPECVLGWNMPKQARVQRADLVDYYTRPRQPVTP
ncbi:NAD(P)/FAD-dependent oxidoreductase [Streptomyces shenzhenensis]|uniref:FAD-dependent oxidoreductase n=1 Tax=Streptomyces shenzhenensis TaxID=943815 RepID=A0A3M0HTU0_9ACTN|nr:FAD-dependent oxidoreductase [Streptomyces shenzhenensis]RMB80387.1 FAD-dependent oxidoreductase [Streptomyces shenzhenensis]